MNQCWSPPCEQVLRDSDTTVFDYHNPQLVNDLVMRCSCWGHTWPGSLFADWRFVIFAPYEPLLNSGNSQSIFSKNLLNPPSSISCCFTDFASKILLQMWFQLFAWRCTFVWHYLLSFTLGVTAENKIYVCGLPKVRASSGKCSLSLPLRVPSMLHLFLQKKNQVYTFQ